MFTEKEAGRSVVLLLCALFGVLLFCYLRLKLTKKC